MNATGLTIGSIVYRLALQNKRRPKKRGPKRFQDEQRAKKTFLSALRRSFASIHSRVKELGEQAVEAEGSTPKAFHDLALADNMVSAFIDQFNITGNLEETLLKRLSDYAFGKKNVTKTHDSLNRLLEPAYVELARQKAQEQMHEVGITPDIIARILPASFTFEVGPDNKIVDEFSVFGNKVNTAERKSKAIGTLLSKWNELAERLNADMESEDPLTRLSALVASIVVSTGIRPGKGGLGKLKTLEGEIVRDEDGKPIKVETVGATGLQQEHVEFVRDDFARLQFPGKSGTINIAKLDDPTLVKVLRKQIESVRADDPDSGLIFTTTDGKEITPIRLNKYFRSILGPSIQASDFRKLKATQTFYDALRDGKTELAEQLLELKTEATDAMKKKIVEVVLSHLETAAKQAQETLSHEDVATTIGNYISPHVVLHYLTNAGLDVALDKVIGDGKNLKVKFDPLDFYNKVRDESMPAVDVPKAANTLFGFGDKFTDIDVDELLGDLLEPKTLKEQIP